MDLYQQNQTHTVQPDHALPMQTILHEQYELTGISSAEPFGIVYSAKHLETKKQVRILELIPAQYAARSEQDVKPEPDAASSFQELKLCFQTAAQKLTASTPMHFLKPEAFFEEYGTIYCVFPQIDSKSLILADLPMTPSYLRSLGIELCETYSALHKLGLCAGRLTPEDIRICPDGSFYLSPEKTFAALMENTTAALDLHRFSSLLSELLDGWCMDAEDQPEMHSHSILNNVLQYRFQSAALLQHALICADGTLEKPKTANSSRKHVFRVALCLLFFVVGITVIVHLCVNRLPLQLSVDWDIVKPDVISVWMPMEEGTDETEIQEMYQKLAAGFEKKYPGFGVDLIIYADNSFPDALQFEETGDELPTVFMNTEHEIVQDMAADITLLTHALDDSYLIDMEKFDTAVPLGWSFPAVYYNAYSSEEITGTTIEFSELDSSISYDPSVAAFLDWAEPDTVREESSFSAFMEIRDNQPFLASTACLAMAERSAISSGAVRMLPVTVDGFCQMQYEMYCSINRKKDWNSQHIGMLWLQYLLTEEAQQILFAEYYSVLPLHSNALPQALENHEALSVVNDIITGMDGAQLH